MSINNTPLEVDPIREEARVAAAGLVETLEAALTQLEQEKGGLLVEWRARIHKRGQEAIATWTKFLEEE